MNGDYAPSGDLRRLESMRSRPLTETHPDLAVQAVGWDPGTVSRGSNTKLNWRCDLGHTWMATPNARTYMRSGCPVCSGQQLLPGFNDLVTSHPELAQQAVGWDPSTVSRGSNKKVKWRCTDGHFWTASIAHRSQASGATGCPICSGATVLAGFNDLATTDPKLAEQADGWDPATVSRGSGKRVSWQCAFGHRWEATPNNRSNGKGCPVCSGRAVVAGFNDLATTDPGIASQADGWDPTTVTRSSHRSMKWKCERAHTWTAPVAGRTSGNGCPYCGNRRLLVGFNDLATTHPEIAREADDWDPSSVMTGSNKRVAWTCEFGHQWKTQVNNRTFLGTGCPTCAVGGFSPSEPAWLYLLEHDLWGLLQIGVSNDIETRLKAHGRAGWNLVEPPRGPMDGLLTYRWEQSILAALRRRGVELGVNGVGKFDGYTEAWIEETFPARSLRELMDLVEDDDALEIPT